MSGFFRNYKKQFLQNASTIVKDTTVFLLPIVFESIESAICLKAPYLTEGVAI